MNNSSRIQTLARKPAVYPTALAVAGLAAFGLAVAFAATPGAGDSGAENDKRLLAVVHVNFADAERQEHGLKNIENILKQAHDGAEIEVVCHGPGIGLLVGAKTKQADEIKKLLDQGVRFAACENTMKKQSLTKDDLLPGVTTVASGAVEIIRQQQQGFAYFKP
jgi:intracellular sulfur oxidation DsrE/DsrF family protein